MKHPRGIRAPGFAARWFESLLCLFVVAMPASIGVVALGPLPQLQFIGAVTLAGAAVGALVCAIGVRLYHPSRWRALHCQVEEVGASLREVGEVIGEPRAIAYARVAPHDYRHLRGHLRHSRESGDPAP
jgi:hypothetical protein